ncbi:MAG: hypothetical protein ACRDTE_13515 [Pseudonocardiaceae bacterium]
MITPESVEALRRRALLGQLSARERAVLSELLVALDAAVHVHQAGPGPLWARVASQFRGLVGDRPRGEESR